MLSPSEVSLWQSAYNVSYYVLLAGLFVSFIATGMTFIANNRLTGDLTERLTQTTNSAAAANEHAAKIEREFGWRRLTQDEIEHLVKSIDGIDAAPYLNYTTLDSEAFYYADQIAGVLKKTNIKFIPHNVTPLSSAFGMTIGGNDKSTVCKIAKAFREAGIDVSIGPINYTADQEQGHLAISIGSRFPPHLDGPSLPPSSLECD